MNIKFHSDKSATVVEKDKSAYVSKNFTCEELNGVRRSLKLCYTDFGKLIDVLGSDNMPFVAMALNIEFGEVDNVGC